MPIFLLFFGTIQSLSVDGQNSKIPNWINGTWQNSFESNTNNFETWTFINDSITIRSGLPGTSECLNTTYLGYKKTVVSNDSMYQFMFSKLNSNIVYEFKLKKTDCSPKPVLTYSLIINDIIKREHYSSCNLVLTKPL